MDPSETTRADFSTPYEVLKRHYTLPFELYPFQQETVNALASLTKAGYYLDPGTGKTASSTASALIKKALHGNRTLVIMPPILISMWARWLKQIPGIDVLAYRGTPNERKSLKLQGDFILMSIQIFKKDFDRIFHELHGKPLTIIVDEATSVKNIGSDNHQRLFEMQQGHDLMLLTGTPLSTPMDAYAYCKLVAPGVYRNKQQFENIHVVERDFFDKVTKWGRLDLLAENMKINSVRLLKEDVLKDLPPITYTPIFYDLAPDHQRLYIRLAEEQVLKLESGGKIDATQTTALYHALQQIVLNYAHFSGDPTKRSAGYDLIDEVLDEIGDRKLIIFASYRMTNAGLVGYLKKHNAVAVYGAIPDKQKFANVDTFIDNPKCRVLVAQPTSAGYGVDGLQHVCSDVLFLEEPVVPMQFHQACARVHRDGQRNNTNVRIAVAEGTLQVRLHRDLLNKDELVNRVQGGFQDLKDAIYGRT